MVRATILNLAAACLLSAAFPAISALIASSSISQTIGLLEERQSDISCAITGYQSCRLSGPQANFCCPQDTSCVPFNNNASVICCAAGHNNCQAISPTSCDVSQNNATLHPDNELHSIDFGGPLVKCGSDCCPQGFACDNNAQCIMKPPTAAGSSAAASASAASTSGISTSNSALPTTTLPILSFTSTTSSSSSKTVSSSSTPTSSSSTPSSTVASHPSTPSPTNTPTSAPATTPTPASAKNNPFPAPIFLAGFFPGILIGILVAVAMIVCIGRRRSAKEAKKDHNSDFSSVTATVSDPIYNPDHHGPTRTDFLRRDSAKMFAAAPSFSTQNTQNARTSHVRSLFSRSPTFRDGIGRSIVPKTPEMGNYRTPDLKHEPSSESIRIYSPPNIALGGDDRNTRFTDMMRDAGFKAGEPYLGSPARVSPGAVYGKGQGRMS